MVSKIYLNIVTDAYLWSHISLVAASKISLLERAMHLLIWLGIVICSDSLGLYVFWAMLMGMNLWKIPVFLSPTYFLIIL